MIDFLPAVDAFLSLTTVDALRPARAMLLRFFFLSVPSVGSEADSCMAADTQGATRP